MNKLATVRVHGNAGVGLAENIMSGTVVVDGYAGQSCAASGRGGLVVVRGDASARCGISMKGVEIVVAGSVGHMSAFMAQKGALVVCGDAGDALGDSIYEARLYVRGSVASLGADCVEKELRAEHAAAARRAARARGRRRGPGRVPPLRLGARALQLRHRQRGRVLVAVDGWHPGLRESATFDRNAIAEIQRAASEGIYDIRGWGAKRRVPHFDDLLFLGASVSRYPLEGYRERCATDVVLGDRHATKPLELQIPITIAGMSFGALSAPAKEALGRGATAMGTATTTGDGGMTEEERGHSATLVYQLLPSRYGMNPDDLRRCDAIEVVVGQGAKPGGGGMLLGQKISDRVAEMRDLPKGIDQRSACRHPDWTGPDDLEIKIGELREITDWEKPIFVKIGATRTYYDVALAVKAGADVIVLDGMQGGTAATQEVFIEHVGIPILAAIPLAVEALQELDMHRRVQLVVSGGIRTGADVAKALALGADAVSIGVAALIALGDNAPRARAASTPRSAPPPATTTTGTRAATRPGSRPRTTSSPRASTPSSAAAGSRTTCARSRSRRRRSRAPAASPTCTTSSPRTSSRSRSKRPRWRASRSPARAGSPEPKRCQPLFRSARRSPQGASLGSGVLTIRTEQGALCETEFGTLPSSLRSMPLLPITSTSAPLLSASWTRIFAGSPSRASLAQRSPFSSARSSHSRSVASTSSAGLIVHCRSSGASRASRSRRDPRRARRRR